MTQGIVSDTKRRRGRARKSLQPAHAALDETPESPEPSPPDSVPAGRHKRAAAAKPLPADPPSPDGDEVEEDEEDDFRPTRHRAGAGSKNVAEQDTEDADYRPERSGPPHIQAALGPGSTRKRRKSTTPVTADDRSETARELLSEEQKRANHIESEKKRRQNIRAGFERLVEMVPDLKADTAGRGATIKNEALILQKSHEYIEELKRRRIELQSRILAHRTQLSDPSDYLLADSEDEDSDRQAPARLAQIQQLAKQAVGSEELPTADVVFALAAQGRLTSAGPGMVQGD